jgi:6-pyruvoyltetrahydropterin/6-carboxytetrahydropterin synthase
MFELKVLTRFAGAHQLQMVGEKCENLHGHNWKIEVCVRGPELNSAGVLVDFGEIKAHVRSLIAELDHKYLNELEWFDNTRPPSSENIAIFLASGLQQRLDSDRVKVSRVTAWESEDASATYFCSP